jgi:hypothetical protein
VEQLYDLLLEMNSHNTAANVAGQDELSNTYNTLADPGASDSNSNDGIGADIPDKSLALGGLQQSNPSATHRRSLELTAAERALDEDTPPASPANINGLSFLPDLDFGDSYTAPSLPTPASGLNPTPAPTSGTPAPAAAQTPPAESATNSSNNASCSSCPPVKGGAFPRRCGKTKDAPKKDDLMGAGMLMFMHKSQEQTTRWMMDERKQADEI